MRLMVLHAAQQPLVRRRVRSHTGTERRRTRRSARQGGLRDAPGAGPTQAASAVTVVDERAAAIQEPARKPKSRSRQALQIGMSVVLIVAVVWYVKSNVADF